MVVFLEEKYKGGNLRVVILVFYKIKYEKWV